MFVTHDIDEAVFLSDIVVVFSGRPAVIKEIIEVDFPRPLDVHKTQKFLDLRNHIWDLLHQEHSKLGEDDF
jgi:NitT/TauT family transport system ATP-binding protein